MQIKVFTAPRLHEALGLVRKGLGPDAIVLDRMEGVDENGFKVWHVHAALDQQHEVSQKNDDKASRKPSSSPQHDVLYVKKLESSMQRLERIVEGLGRKESENLRLAMTDKSVQEAFDTLVGMGVAPSYAFDLAEDFAVHKPIGTSLLPWGERIKPQEKPVVMLLAGPSGAGKSLLAAKLATHYSMRGVRVSLMTTDVNRMGGSEALKSYADVLGAAFYTLRQKSDVQAAMQGAKTAQLLLIDSEGWNSHRSAASKNQCAIWQELPCTHRVFVMPANMDEIDGMELLAAIEAMNMTHIAFTKLDETSSPGKIINWSMASKLGLSYGGFGPDVPEQMGWLTAQAMTALLESKRKKVKGLV